MKILYVAQHEAVGKDGRKVLFPEYTGIYLSLLKMGHNVIHQDLARAYTIGFEAFTREIQQKVVAEKPDMLFVWMNHELDKAILRDIARNTSTVTVSYFSDEDTDLYLRSLDWVGVFDWTLVSFPPSYDEFKQRGENVIGMNWAANIDFFKPIPGIVRDIDVGFVGALKPERKVFIKKLEEAGIKMSIWGPGWPNGPIDNEGQLALYSRSKINLNLGFGRPIAKLKTLARVFFSPAQNRLGFMPDFWHARRNFKTIMFRKYPQWRGRPFEVLACRTFLMTNRGACFGEPYKENEEIVYYDNAADAIKKIKYYLGHDEEREKIAEASYQRCLREHTLQKRLQDTFDAIYRADPKRRGGSTIV